MPSNTWIIIVFSKCADYMEEGRRLENLSWRLWTRETFCVEPESSCDTSVLPLLRAEAAEVPPLSASVDSVASDEAERIESHIKRPRALDYKPAVVGEDTLIMCRGKEKHITSLGLERMVLNIKEKKGLEPLSAHVNPISPPVVDITPRASSPTPAPASYPAMRHPHHSAESCSTTAPEGNESDAVAAAGSDTSVSSSGVLPPKHLTRTPSIVRGFSPSHISSSYRSNPRMSMEKSSDSQATTQQKPTPIKRKGGMFQLGGSSGDDESSFEERMVGQAPAPHRSSLSEELSKPGNDRPTSSPSKKVASFKDEVESRTIKPIKEGAHEDEDAIETDDEISESAIEDDDEDEDWEDSVTESGQSSMDDKELFQRVDSRPNLVSRRSLLTMMMHQPAKMNATRSTPALQRSRLTSPNGPSVGGSPEDDGESLTMRGPDVPRSKPIIVKPTSQASVAHSPRTTRRNMLATELTESLRRHLLWERQQKSATANAVFKRRHTAHDMANLHEYPGPKGTKGVNMAGESAGSKDVDTSKNNSWNNYNDYGPWEYHVKGW
jgi:hypothetical protein